MRTRLGLVLVGAVVLVVFATAGTTGALWRDAATIDAGTVTTGTLELLVGGQPESYVFHALSAANLGPGDSNRAPLTITNSGSTLLTYKLASVSAGLSDPTASVDPDDDLATALTLRVTTDKECDGTLPVAGEHTLYDGPLATATFEGCELAPSSSVDLQVTVGLPDTTPISASQGAVSATFIFRGDQVQ